VLCPLHDDTRPSLTLDVDRGLWFCFACAEGGDAIELWQRVRGCSFAEAVRELAA
jgi:DNA primase